MNLVFTTKRGTALDSRNVTRYLQAHLLRLGLPHQRFHSLRHAFATMLIESGEDPGVVSRILGHADYATTADVYAHLTPVMRDRSAASVAGFWSARDDLWVRPWV
jgi:integrase